MLPLPPKHTSPKVMLPQEWGAMFIKYLVKRKVALGRYKEINVRELVKKANTFALAMQIRFGASITGNEILDYCLNQGWLVPSATDTFIIRDDIAGAAKA